MRTVSPSEGLSIQPGGPLHYHKRAFVYIGNLAVLTTFDTGRFQNAVQLEFLEELGEKQRSGQLGAQVVSRRAPCGKHEVFGATDSMKGSYDEVVELKFTFKGSDARSATVVITFVVMAELLSPLILGAPLWISSCSP